MANPNDELLVTVEGLGDGKVAGATVALSKTAVVRPAALANTNGVAVVVTPDAPHTSLEVESMTFVYAGLATETVQTQVTATFEDGTQATYTESAASDTENEALTDPALVVIVGGIGDATAFRKNNQRVVSLRVVAQATIPGSDASVALVSTGTQA